MSAKRAYELLNKLAFTRVSGTEEELKAANIILDEIKPYNNTARIEEFNVNYYKISHASLVDENGNSYTVTGYGYSGNADVTAPFYYMETFGEVDKKKAEGCIVLINGRLGYDAYETLVKCKVKGFITFGGDITDTEKNSDLDERELRQMVIDYADDVVLPGVNMRVKEAMRLVKKNPKSLTLKLVQTQTTTKSHNVICEIEGGDLKEEKITYTAHYDSVPFSLGVYDNGAGSVIIYELFRHYTEHKPRRSLRFIWCGSEERGLLGSKAYVKDHEDDLKNTVLNINVDVGAAVLGKEFAMVTADESLKHYVDYLFKMHGLPVFVSQDIYSSDGMPFVDKNVPSISFARFGAPGAAHIHDRHDTMMFLSAKALEKTLNNVLLFSKNIVDSEVFPIPKTIPANIVEKTNKYLRKKEK